MTVRLRFAKLGRLRFTSHRDVARMWERALRRAGLALAYTGGFSPRPQISFGLALPTGCESTAEYLDVTFAEPLDAAALPELLDPLLPEGLHAMAAAAVEPGGASLQQDVTSCAWDISVPVALPDLQEAVGRTLGATSLPVHRERKGRHEVEDLRPSVLDLRAVAGAEGPGSTLVAELATRPRGVRPAELAEAVGLELGLARRTCQWIEREGSRSEPLAPGAWRPALAMGRAS